MGFLLLAALAMPAACGEAATAVPEVEGWPPAKTHRGSASTGPSVSGEKRATGRRQGVKRVPKAKLPTSLRPCLTLVDTACDFLGTFSQECDQARASVRRRKRPELQIECKQILRTFQAIHAKDGRRNPCYVLARRVCSARGKHSSECRDRRAAVDRLTKPTEKRACRGDLLLEAARTVLDSAR